MRIKGYLTMLHGHNYVSSVGGKTQWSPSISIFRQLERLCADNKSNLAFTDTLHVRRFKASFSFTSFVWFWTAKLNVPQCCSMTVPQPEGGHISTLKSEVQQLVRAFFPLPSMSFLWENKQRDSLKVHTKKNKKFLPLYLLSFLPWETKRIRTCKLHFNWKILVLILYKLINTAHKEICRLFCHKSLRPTRTSVQNNSDG